MLLIEPLESRIAPATFTVTNTANAGPGSLRQAILDANLDSGADEIAFSLGEGAHTIRPLSALPTITAPVSIYDQQFTGVFSAPAVELDGSLAGAGVDGLRVASPGVSIEGVAINRFSGDGIEVEPGGSVKVGDCYVGLGVDGSSDAGNGGAGILLRGANSEIGIGTRSSDRSFISGNTGPGIEIAGPHGINNRIAHAHIGTNSEGTGAVPNAIGVLVRDGATDTRITSVNGTGNVISGNLGDGIRLDAAGNGTIIANAVIGAPSFGNGGNGITVDGTANVLIDSGQFGVFVQSNHGHGIEIRGGSTDVRIASTGIGTTFSYGSYVPNEGDGIRITDGQRVTVFASYVATKGAPGVSVLGSSTAEVMMSYIPTAGFLPVDLGGNGPTLNDPGDSDLGPNAFLNSPALTKSLYQRNNYTTISGEWLSAPGLTATIYIYGRASADQPMRLIESVSNVMTDANGRTAFSFERYGDYRMWEMAAAATITDSNGVKITSEYSPGAVVPVDLPALSISAEQVLESTSETRMGFVHVSLSRATGDVVTVNYSTLPGAGTATENADYTPICGTITFLAGQTVQSIYVPILPDDFAEGNESVVLQLSSPTNAALSPEQSTAAVLIADAGGLPAISVTVGSVVEPEGNTTGTLELRFQLSAASNVPVTADVATVSGTAVAGVDFTSIQQTLTFAPGETEKTISVTILPDRLPESLESFSVVVGNVANATVLEFESDAIISDTDTTLKISANKRVAEWRDIDGDYVKLVASKPVLAPEQFLLSGDSQGGELLLAFAPSQSGVSFSLTAVRNRVLGVGDGSVHVGEIRADGLTLGDVTIDGDLGRIVVGGSSPTKLALRSLTAHSLARFGVATQLASPEADLVSRISGNVGTIKIGSDAYGTLLIGSLESGAPVANAGSIQIRGGMYGADTEFGGSIIATGSVANLKIGNLIGGVATSTGVFVGGSVGKFVVNGLVLGQSAANPVEIQIGGAPGTSRALGSFSVANTVQYAAVRTGFGLDGFGAAGNANIGRISVGGDWIASSINAGLLPGQDGVVGTPDDYPAPGHTNAGTIASIVIKGYIAGTPGFLSTTDSFVLTAHRIASFQIGRTLLDLTANQADQLRLSVTADVFVVDRS